MANRMSFSSCFRGKKPENHGKILVCVGKHHNWINGTFLLPITVWFFASFRMDQAKGNTKIPGETIPFNNNGANKIGWSVRKSISNHMKRSIFEKQFARNYLHNNDVNTFIIEILSINMGFSMEMRHRVRSCHRHHTFEKNHVWM